LKKVAVFGSVIKLAVATVAVVGLHSLLASTAAKRAAVSLVGERARNGLYRLGYNGVALATSGALSLYALRLPNREIYRVRGPVSWLMRSAQGFFLAYMVYAAKEVGFLQFSGAPNAAALVTGQEIVPREPEGQGPILRNSSEVKVTGPFRLSRHPLNFGMIPIIWLMPRMTVNLVAFNVITSAYLVVGSLHEEKRLAEAYGSAYADYQKSRVGFFLPRLTSSTVQTKEIAQ
jgi:hypothetical protein